MTNISGLILAFKETSDLNNINDISYGFPAIIPGLNLPERFFATRGRTVSHRFDGGGRL
jgi:hypothetical protein